MPTLDWIGKRAVANHHREVPYHLLKVDEALSAGDPASGNLLIRGDNLLALKAILPYYAGQVKCIYIDPPYNTGKDKWVYDDRVNHPEIRAWLGKVVGKEAEDLCRHDKWLCMMYPRLILAREFLAESGAIFVSIDDTEVHHLRSIMDEIFRPSNRLASFVWQTEGNFDNQGKVKVGHEYVLAYARDVSQFPAPPVIDPSVPPKSKLFRKDIQNTIVKNGPKNPVSDLRLPVGFPADFQDGEIPARTDSWPHYSKRLVVQSGRLQEEVVASSGWSCKRIVERFISNGFQPVRDSRGKMTEFFLTSTGTIEGRKPRGDIKSHVVSVLKSVGTTQQMSADLASIGIKFDYPKPVGLIKYLISMIADRDCVVLDFFAGSGTTGQAVLELSLEDPSSKRKFVLVELDKDIAENITAKRLRYAITGVGEMPALGSGFRFCNIGASMFDVQGNVSSDVNFATLAAHVYFTETGGPLVGAAGASPLLGIHQGVGIYLLFNGILGDTSINGGNVLTPDVLASLPTHEGQKVIYGEGCRIGHDQLRRKGITFKQTPYGIKVG